MLIRKLFKAEIAHRLVSSYSKKCQSIHGHSYLFEIIMQEEHLNEDGMVVDFGEIKAKINHLFDAWDHSFMFYAKDPLADHYRAMTRVEPIRMVEVDYNPTAEQMAYHVFRACVEEDVPVSSIRVHETTTGWAEASRPKPFVGENVTYYNIPEIHKQKGGCHVSK
jgi:6-pyruvoyltetrahydropterin/6-carboxytetrahydropterin synthase